MVIPPKIYLAPFQGITGITFRSVYSKHFTGVDKLFTPFFTGISSDNKLSARKLAELGTPFENGVEVRKAGIQRGELEPWLSISPGG